MLRGRRGLSNVGARRLCIRRSTSGSLCVWLRRRVGRRRFSRGDCMLGRRCRRSNRRACWRRGGRFGLAHELLLVGQHSRGLSGRHRLDHRPRRVEHHIDRAAGDGREGSEREEEFFDGWSPRRASPFTAKKAATACLSPPFLSSLGLIWGEVSERQQGRREKSKPCKNHCASAEPDYPEREPADNKDDRGSRAWMRSPSGTTSSSAFAICAISAGGHRHKSRRASSLVEPRRDVHALRRRAFPPGEVEAARDWLTWPDGCRRPLIRLFGFGGR